MAVFDYTFLNIDVGDVVSYDFTISYRIADSADALTATTLSNRLDNLDNSVSTNAQRISTLESRVDSQGTQSPSLGRPRQG